MINWQQRKWQVVFLTALPTLLILVGLFLQPLHDLLPGMLRILQSQSVLLSDYLEIGGAGATLINAGLCGFICIGLMMLYKIDINGPFIAAVYTVIGFAFFGKNIWNIWPIFIGVFLYAAVRHESFRNYALIGFFATTLGPLVSFIAFGAGLEPRAGIALGMTLGIFVGFIAPPLASAMLRFHDGYNIYNIGFTGGIIGSVVVAVLRSFGLVVAPVSILTGRYDLIMKALFFSFFLLMVVGGLFVQPNRIRKTLAAHYRIMRTSGRLVTDFTLVGRYNATIFNMGLMGIIAGLFVIALGGEFNGPVIGGILTIVGFAAFGKHPRNCIPVMLGVVIGGALKIWDIGSTPVIIAGLFGTTLAPVAGQYGPFWGMLAGFLHTSVVMNVGVLHGGVNLYNNGFAGGFVAGFLVPIIEVVRPVAGPPRTRRKV
ncbi:MAG: DUF1576 domain-containing protein [Spirochaetaceae bacterium]|nr:MAG: DUF1576 domain-containing protein [Spirochaetaceae bacterium]